MDVKRAAFHFGGGAAPDLLFFVVDFETVQYRD